MAGTEIMTVADLNTMEARVDIGEMDVPLISRRPEGPSGSGFLQGPEIQRPGDRYRQLGQQQRHLPAATASTSTDATKFQVKIRVTDKEAFLPGMSVTANIETRYRTNVLTVPIQSVTTRLPKAKSGGTNAAATHHVVTATAMRRPPTPPRPLPAPTAPHQRRRPSAPTPRHQLPPPPKKPDEPPKPIEVVFVVEGDHVKMVPVKRGISDDNYVEIMEGLHEGQEVVSGGYKAINRDLADDGKK